MCASCPHNARDQASQRAAEKENPFAPFGAGIPPEFKPKPLRVTDVLQGQDDVDTTYVLAQPAPFFSARPQNVQFAPRAAGSHGPSLRLESVHRENGGAPALWGCACLRVSV